jgi:hypothetical protein
VSKRFSGGSLRSSSRIQFDKALAPFLVSVAACLISTGAWADPATVGPVVIAVPEGFEAAHTQRLEKTLVTAWTKSVPNGSRKTLLQIDVVDLGQQHGKPPSQQDLSIGAEKYLRQFLGGIERRRTHYVSSPVAHIKLAGLPAVRATWNGNIGERAVVGVMYSVIVRNRFAVIFHTQDLGSAPSSGMFEAMRSIESMHLAPERDPAGIS